MTQTHLGCFDLPARCSRRGCHRRPRKIHVELMGGGVVKFRMLALCRRCSERYASTIQTEPLGLPGSEPSAENPEVGP
jgi:hypothetical protein